MEEGFGRKHFWVRMLGLFLAGMMVILLPGMESLAAVKASSGGAVSTNIHAHEYSWYSQEQPQSFLYATVSGFTRVEALGEKVVVEQYSTDFVFQDSKEIDYELPIFGGFYRGSNYNFLVYGQENKEENNQVEIMRVVKYDKSWNRLGSLSYHGCNTHVPFEAGTVSFAEYEDILYIRTCHTMYKSNDGYNHQACMTFSMKQSDMSQIDSFYSVMNIGVGYSSHSFNQFIRIVGNKIVALDHGDAYPRSVVVGMYSLAADVGDVDNSYYNVNLLEIPGSVGQNYTGVNVGGFEASSTHFLAAVNTIDFDNFSNSRMKNLKLLTLPINNMDESAVVVKDITNYEENGKVSVTNPFLVPMENDTFALIWEESERNEYQYGTPVYYDRIKIATVNASGDIVGNVRQVAGSLSDCQPIYANGNLVWYVTDSSEPIFYSVPMKEKQLDATITHTCAVQNNLALNYKVRINSVGEFENIRLHVQRQVFGDSSRKYAWEETELTKYSKDEDGRYVFTFSGIAAAEMGNVIEATVYAELNGVTYQSSPDVYSIRMYAEDAIQKLENSAIAKERALCTLMVDMLNYGSRAQACFSRNTTRRANRGLTSSQLELASELPTSYVSCKDETAYEGGPVTATVEGRTLSIDNSVELNAFVRFGDTAPTEATSVEFRYKTIKGDDQTVKIGRKQLAYDSSKDRYCASLNTISAADFSQPITIIVYDGNSQISNTYTYSIESYAFDSATVTWNTSLNELLKYMMAYSNSAKAFFQ